MLGFGRGCLGQLFQTIFHALFLVSPCPQDLCEIARSIFAWCSDYGTEHGLANVEPVRFVDVSPYLRTCEMKHPVCIGHDGDDDFAEPGLLDEPEPEFAPGLALEPQNDLDELKIDVSASIEVPGVTHVLHNIGRGMESHLLKYKDGVFRLGKVANVLRKKENKSRLKATCFSDDVAKEELHRKYLARFKSQCHLERWGTVVDTVMAMTRDVEASLRLGWCLHKFMNGSDEHPQLEEEAEDNEHANRIDLVDSTIRSEFWWAYFRMLQHICKVMRKAIRWSEACSCHEGLLYGEDYGSDDSDDDDERVPQRIRAAAKTCPFRGRRAPELATGDLVEFVGKIHTQVAADVLLDIPSSLDDEDRKAIMQDYDRARIFFVSVLTLKMAHWGELPFSCFGIGHHDKSKTFASYQRAMGSDSCHPLVTTLKSNRFEEDRAIYEEHKGHLELVPYEEPAMYRKTQAPHMRACIAKLKVTPTAERPVEATHAVIHKEVRRAPNH